MAKFAFGIIAIFGLALTAASAQDSTTQNDHPRHRLPQQLRRSPSQRSQRRGLRANSTATQVAGDQVRDGGKIHDRPPHGNQKAQPAKPLPRKGSL